MGVAVLYPHHTVTNKLPNHYQAKASHFPNMKLSTPNPNPKSIRSFRSRKKRPDTTPQDLPCPAQPTKPQKHQPQQLLMGQVKILKRGELLTQTTPDLQLQMGIVKELSTQMKTLGKEVPRETETVRKEVPRETETVQKEVPRETETVQKKVPKETETVQKEVARKTKAVEKSSLLPLPGKIESLYAGYSMLVMSPPPSSVPLPAFITKKIAAVNCATTDLRKMLRLDFP